MKKLIIYFLLALLIVPSVSLAQGTSTRRPTNTTTTPSNNNRQRQQQQQQRLQQQRQAELQRQQREAAERQRQAELQRQEEQRQQQEAAERQRQQEEAAERQRQEEEARVNAIIQNLISNMVRVEGGTFTMGATPEQGSDEYRMAEPAHQVTVSSFSIGKYEVTQEEWRAVMGSNPSNFIFRGSKRPVEQVSWNDCQEFISKLNAKTGMHFHLPTEAQWEYAARGGNRSQHYKYAGSSVIESVAWFDDNSGSQTHDVGTKAPNELGLYDMSGNVSEWCYDWYGRYSGESQTNPAGPASGSYRVNRGGFWFCNASGCRVSNRGNCTPDYGLSHIGLRLAL